MQNTPNLPAQTSVDGRHVTSWLPASMSGDTPLITCMPQATPQDRMRIVQLLSGDCLSADDCIGATLRIKGYIMHPCTVSDGDTGEQKDAIRTILVQDDGEPVAFVSRTIIDQIQRLAYIRDDQAPWDPPIVARLRQKSHGANRVYILVPESE